MTIFLADVSEFQQTVDWAAYGAAHPAVIVRAHNGWREDHFWLANQIGARQHCAWRGWYQYLPASIDASAAARAFAAAVGTVQAGEVMILDLEEGLGNQDSRMQTWLNTLQAKTEWVYSGLYFARDHLPGATVQWVAAYGQSEPSQLHRLWQYSSTDHFPGIAGNCDGSQFDGSLSQLQALSGPTPTPPVPPKPVVPPFLGVLRQGTSNAQGVREAQAQLRHRGWTIVIDGNFGPATLVIVEAFQTQKHLTVDGVIGPVTWNALWLDPVT